MNASWRLAAGLALAFLATAAGVRAGSASTADNGTFRFLTLSLPDGSTNAEYVARLQTANADGQVTFSAAGLPPGVLLDTQSGFLTGRPTVVGNYQVDLGATDGTNTLALDNVPLKISAAGGGGNEGATFAVGTLPGGKVGTAYSYTLTVSNGVGPYTFGAVDLPPGITLNGQTGVLSGTPLAAGTWFTGLSVYDAGENNKVVKIVPLPVEPAASTFQFTTKFLNNGEVGTIYWDQWATTGADGTVTFGASGLPPGLSVDSATGEVSGTPTTAGTFYVNLSATDSDGTISTNLQVLIVPSAASNMYWDFFGIPTGFLGVSYDRQPPIAVAVKNNTGTVTYAAAGIPGGMAYSTTTGELTGTPLEVGEYPVTFTATDGTTGEVLVLSMDIIVLPPYGGDASSITTNLWVSKEVLKTGVAGRDSWTGTATWNADRRAANVFDATDPLRMEIGSFVVPVPGGSWTGTAKKYTFATPRGEVPAVKVQVSPQKQTLKWTVKSATIPETVPATLRHVTVLGGRGYRLEEAFSEKGQFKPALDYRKTAFVVSRGAVAAGIAGKDSVKLSLYLADPNFSYAAGTSTLRIRLLDGATQIYAKDFTALGTATTSTARDGTLLHRLKSLKDTADADRLSKFAFTSVNGKMSLALSDLTLTGVPGTEAHLGVELTIGDRIYYTAVTLFETRTGKYTTTMPL